MARSRVVNRNQASAGGFGSFAFGSLGRESLRALGRFGRGSRRLDLGLAGFFLVLALALFAVALAFFALVLAFLALAFVAPLAFLGVAVDFFVVALAFVALALAFFALASFALAPACLGVAVFISLVEASLFFERRSRGLFTGCPLSPPRPLNVAVASAPSGHVVDHERHTVKPIGLAQPVLEVERPVA